MALILLVSKRLATFWTRERTNATPRRDSVFHDLLKHVPGDVWSGSTGRTGGAGDCVPRTSSLPVREVRVETATGKVPRILRNDLDAPAQDIADL